MATATLPLPVSLNGPLLTRRQAAEYLGVSPQTLAVWACTGRYNLPLVRVGRLAKYRRCDLDSWIARRTRASGGQEEE